MSVTILIPARFASTRLPGKPLLCETGKPLIQHVYEAVQNTPCADRVVVATDDERILETVEAFGGAGVLTRTTHETGSDRLAEACELLGLADDDIVVNVQGDEPDIPPGLVDCLVDILTSADTPMATLATPLSADEALDPNKVKVILDEAGLAIYFSRQRIPYDRDDVGTNYLLHLGIYAYRAGFLRKFSRLAPTALEKIEKLEQLRALEHGHRIAVAVVDYDGVGIDTPEDYAQFVARMK